MTTTTNVKQTKLNIMTQAQYNSITPSATELYMVTDAQISYNDLTDKPTIPDTSNLANKDLSNLSSTGNSKFQAPLVSGTNIKTINNESLLGSGNITISGGGTSLPDQTGKAGLYLQTDGSNPSWQGVPGRNLGQIIPSTIPLTDAGLHLLDGALINGSGIYSAFVDYIASIYDASANYFCTEQEWQTSITHYGVCGKFVYDSVNNTVRLPKVTGIIEGTIDVTALGDLVEAGLPNITGRLGLEGQADNQTSDAIYVDTTDTAPTRAITSTQSGYPNKRFDASLSNPIYGNSSMVQPQTIKAFYYIVIATSTKTDIEVDIDEVATDLNGKADTDLTNTTNQAKILMSGMGMPSDTFIDLTLGASGTTYTAPANGYFYLCKIAGSDWYYINGTVIRNGTPLFGNFDSDYRTSPLKIILNVLKGDSVQIDYNATGATTYFRFIYAVGSESEVS